MICTLRASARPWISWGCALTLIAFPGSATAAESAKSEPARAIFEVDPEEVERLQALGYVDTVAPSVSDGSGVVAGDGVILHDRARTQPGLNFHTNAYHCEARLTDLDGETLRIWRHEPCWKWPQSVLLPDGGLLAQHYSPDWMKNAKSTARVRWLLRFDWSGELLWRRQMPVHHDVDWTPSGRIAVLTYEHRLLTAFHPRAKVRDDFIELLDADGEPLERKSVTELLQSAPELFEFKKVKARTKDKQREVDLLHTNSIEWMRDPALAKRNALYALGNVLICMRHQNVIAVFDWEANRLVWAWGRGELSGPHDATVLPSGNILIFDNGLGRGWSRVVELDPLEQKIVWEYRAPQPESFYSDQRGGAQRLANGNTLITNSNAAQAFEVTSGGDVVWDFRNDVRTKKGLRLAIVRMRRVTEGDGGAGARFERSD